MRASSLHYCTYSINVKKSISSEGAALFQYAKRASEVMKWGEKHEKRLLWTGCMCDSIDSDRPSYPLTCS